MARRCALPMLLAVAVLVGCTGTEPETTSLTVPESGTSQEALPTAATETLATSSPAPDTSPSSTEPESAAAEPAETTPADSEEAETATETTAPGEGIVGPEDGALAELDFNRQPRRPDFRNDNAPEWPFSGLIQLWYYRYGSDPMWQVRYWHWHWPTIGTADSAVGLPDFDTDCLGQTAVVVHGTDSVEIGVTDGTNPITYRIPWGGTAHTTEQPTEQLIREAAERASNVDARSEGDLLHLAVGEQSQTYALRDPVRLDGERWLAQARHDGEVLIITVHPAHLTCFSGVTWLSDARTGELLGCGTSTHAVRFVSPRVVSADELVLPDPDAFGTYFSCVPPLDFRAVALPSR